ncbi:MAG: cytidylyltransferase domain-containing protein [Phycisphaerae bacterium]
MSLAVTAVMPMRGNSLRVPGKNLRPLGGRPLFHHVLSSLLACPEVAQVLVDTDSGELALAVQEHFPMVQIVRRPPHLAAADTPMNDVLLHTCQHVDTPLVLQTHSTSPFLRPETFSRAVRLMREVHPANDSVFGVTRLQQRLWTAELEPVNHDPRTLLPTQDLAPLFAENSAMYLFSPTSLAVCRNRIGRRPVMFEVDSLEAIDIDTEADFTLAEAVVAGLAAEQKRRAA